MRIVLDTNVLVRAALSPTGPAAAVLRLLVPPHVFVCSSSILSEVADVLRRDRLRRIHHRDDAAIECYVDELRALAATFVYETAGPRVVPDDPADDHIVTTAVLGNADVLATLDLRMQHSQVREYCRQNGIRVLTDAELLAELR